MKKKFEWLKWPLVYVGVNNFGLLLWHNSTSNSCKKLIHAFVDWLIVVIDCNCLYARRIENRNKLLNFFVSDVI